MPTALKQTVTVEAGGVIRVCSPELIEGAQAEVIILLESPVIEKSAEQKQRAFSECSDSRCLLCGKSREAVKKLILGVHGGVCVDCVILCQEIIGSEKAKTVQP